MFLHTFDPTPIALTLGPISFHWYGLIIVLAISTGVAVASWLGQKNQIKRDTIFDLAFYLIIFSIIGARIYDVLLDLPYYIDHPLQIPQVWQGGLAIHGAILAGALTVYWFVKKYQLNLAMLTSITVTGVAIGQAIGRWGNYFNQELFGQPTDLPWGIYINPNYRPLGYTDFSFFHPTFLYESIGCLLIFIFLLLLHQKLQSKIKYQIITSSYLVLYSLLRFFLEFIKIDETPTMLGLRWPQIISLGVIFTILLYFFINWLKSRKPYLRNT